MMKKTIILTILLAGMATLCFSQTDYTVRNAAAWTQAVNGIRSGGNDKDYTITVTGTVSVPPAPNNVNTFGSVTGVTVTIAGNGTLSPASNGCLLQIGEGQTVVARDVTLRGRSANTASVVDISSGGTFRMEGGATVSGNTEANRNGIGGGVYVDGDFIMQDRASVKDNTARNRNGGGVYVAKGGTLTMQGSASVSGNTAGDSGGGVYVGEGGTFTMLDRTSVSGNTAGYGGGVYVGEGGTFTVQDGSISGNILHDDPSNIGGGVYNLGTFTMQGGMISGNTYVGVYNGVVFNDGAINDGIFTMQGNASVSSNTGYGVCNWGTFTMQDRSSVSGNTGNGVSVFDGTFIMQGNALISGNTASFGFGGGVSVSDGTFTMQGNALISGNTADYGGGVSVSSTHGTFTMQGSASVSGNTAAFFGGGVYVSGGTFTKTGGTIHGDDAEQKLKNTVISSLGHAVYEDQNKGWRNATAGPTMNSDGYGFWLNEGDVVLFPSGFAGTWKRNNFNNTLTIAVNVIKSSSRDVYWVLQRISGNAYTLKRADAANTMTLTIRLTNGNLVISGDSGSGENNWNGTWREYIDTETGLGRDI